MSFELEKLLAEVREIKHILLPDLSGDLGAIRYDTWYKPNISGGGDYFDVVKISRQQNGFGVMMADVSGHGAGAAMEAVMFDAILRTCKSYDIKGPADVLNYVNPHLFTKRLRGNFISAFIFNVSLDELLIRYVNAGHPPAFAITTNDELVTLDESAHIPLCIDRDHLYTETRLDATPFRRFVFYTDGVIELKDAHNEQIGIERFKELVLQSNTLETLKSQVKEIATPDSLEHSDDITVLFVDLEIN